MKKYFKFLFTTNYKVSTSIITTIFLLASFFLSVPAAIGSDDNLSGLPDSSEKNTVRMAANSESIAGTPSTPAMKISASPPSPASRQKITRRKTKIKNLPVPVIRPTVKPVVMVTSHTPTEKKGAPSETKIEVDPENDQEEPIRLSNIKISGVDQTFKVPKAIASRSIVLNFDKADIIEVVAMIAEILEIDYIVEPGVSGQLTIHTTGKIEAPDLFSVLKQILSTANLTIIKEGRYFKIAQMKEATKKPVDTFLGRDSAAIPTDDSTIIQLVPITYLPVESIKIALTPLLTKGGGFWDIPSANILGIIDTTGNIRRLLDLIEVMDVNSFDKMEIKIYPIKFSKAADVAKDLGEVFSAMGIKQKEQYLKFVQIPRINSILVVSASKEYIPIVKKWIKKLDVPEMGEGQKSTFIYKVQNGKAADIASIIKSLFGLKKKNKSAVGTSRKKKTPQAVKTKKTPTRQKKPTIVVPSSRTSKLSDTSEFEGEMEVVTDSNTNSIIIRTHPKNYPIILETIEKLDATPKQVLIEVLIAEIKLGKNTEFGFNWATKKTDINLPGQVIGFAGGKIAVDSDTSGISNDGLSSYFLDTNDFLGVLKAMAGESKLNILSRPTILTVENKPATINVGSSFPVPSNTVSDTGSVSSTSYQYKKVGITLKVTARVNSEKFVSLEIDQNIENPDSGTAAVEGQPPPTLTRQVTTNVVVKDGETLVLGGLIQEVKSNSESGIPWLSKIPLIGWFFGSWIDSRQKNELVVFITPHVIETVAEARQVTELFKSKLDLLKEEAKKNIKQTKAKTGKHL